ncbi:MAG: general stress protein [Solibacillus sp.]
MEYRREIAVAYSLEEALKKVELMRQHGFSEHEIHLFAKNIRPYSSLKMYTEIEVRQAGGLVDKCLHIVYKVGLYEVCLRPFDFSSDELKHYGHCIEKGATFIIAQHDFPIEKKPAKKSLAVSNLLER